jgi:hypothetical protein
VLHCAGGELTFSAMEDVYFLTGLPFRGSALPVDPLLPGDGQLVDLAQMYCPGRTLCQARWCGLG